jgi:prepilin-type N-terminal cleavage/methylation domain-containing protein
MHERLGNRGFSLIEVLVAAALLGVTLLGIGALFARANKEIGEHGDYRQALAIAQSEIEAIQGLYAGHPDLRITNAGGIQVTGGSVIEAVDADGFIRIYSEDAAAALAWGATCPGLETLPGTACPGLYRRVAWVDDPAIDYDGTQRDYKQVTVVVAWPDPLDTSRLNRLDLETFVAK